MNYKVYTILNRCGLVVYVGLTRTTLHKRFQGHIHRKKVRYDEHKISLVQDNLTLEQAVTLEELLIEHYQTRVNGLNVSPKSINGYSNAHSAEQRAIWAKERKGKPVSELHAAKNRKARLGAKNTETHNNRIKEKNSIPIICLNNGKVYPSMKAAAKELGLTHGKVSQVVNGKRPHTKGYKFKFSL